MLPLSTRSSGRIAGLLSALLPGLGQLYNGQYGKGAAFLAGTLALDAWLGLTGDALLVFQSAVAGTPSPSALPSLLLRMLPLLALVAWSVADAVRSGRGTQAR